MTRTTADIDKRKAPRKEGADRARPHRRRPQAPALSDPSPRWKGQGLPGLVGFLLGVLRIQLRLTQAALAKRAREALGGEALAQAFISGVECGTVIPSWPRLAAICAGLECLPSRVCRAAEILLDRRAYPRLTATRIEEVLAREVGPLRARRAGAHGLRHQEPSARACQAFTRCLGPALRAARGARGESQAEVAKALSRLLGTQVGQDYVSRIERDKPVSFERLVVLAKVLGCRPSQLLETAEATAEQFGKPADLVLQKVIEGVATELSDRGSSLDPEARALLELVREEAKRRLAEAQGG